MQINFKLAEETDIGNLLVMMASFNAIDGYHFDERITKHNLRTFIANERLGKLWLIISDENIIGYVVLSFCFSFEFKGRTAFIDELFLLEAFRGKGLGGLVLDFIDQQAREMGLAALHLEVERHNDKGKRLYVKKGFNEHERALMTKRF